MMRLAPIVKGGKSPEEIIAARAAAIMQETKMATGISANKLELVQIADAVAREKGIDIEIVLAAMADAIQKAAKARYGAENDIRVEINPKTGETRLLRAVEVVELVENDDTQISLAIARRENPDAQIGDEIIDELPPVELAVSPRKPPSRLLCNACAKPSANSNMKNLKTVWRDYQWRGQAG